MLASGVRPVRALDLFTLWRQPEIPLRIAEGEWADYRSQVLAGGRRRDSLTRIACLDRRDGSDDESWLLEIVPLDEDGAGALHPVPGEGARLRVSRDILRRQGRLLDAVLSAEQWHDGRRERLSPSDLRDDPLVAASLNDAFVADHVATTDSTTRVVAGRQYLCGQFVLTAADTQRADLPAGTMIQETTREIAAAVHPDIPFLGLAYVSERIRSESRLDPPSRRRAAPPPAIRVEIMELIGFGSRCEPALTGGD